MKAIYVKVLQWRRKELNTILSELDKKCDESKSKKAKTDGAEDSSRGFSIVKALPEDVKTKNAWACN
jgi:hypothetical protein